MMSRSDKLRNFCDDLHAMDQFNAPKKTNSATVSVEISPLAFYTLQMPTP